MSRDTQRWIDQTRNRLSFFLVGAFIGALIALHFRGIPPGNKDLLTYMLGQLSGMALMALGFYFTKGAGQDAQDAARTENTAKALDTIKAAATGKADEAAGAADEVADAAAEKADEIAGERGAGGRRAAQRSGR